MWKAYKVDNVVAIPGMYSVFTRHRDCGYSFSGETHNFWECLYIANGSVRVTAGEKLYMLKGGDIVFHMPLEMHKYDVLSQNGADILVFSFDLEGELTDFFKEKVFTLNLSQAEITNQIISNIELARKQMAANNVQKKHVIEYFTENGCLMQMTAEYIKLLFLQLYSNCSTAKVMDNKDALIFKKLVQYMKSNIKNKLSVFELSKAFFISESTVKRIFKDNVGMGVHTYFFKLKMIEATKLLQSGESVSNIADALGFCDSAYFSTAFKREMGVSPREYLK